MKFLLFSEMKTLGMSIKTKQSLREQEISDLFSNELSDMPSDTYSDSDTDSEHDKKIIILVTESESETESSADESGDSNNVGATTWVKLDKIPTLGQFSGTPGVEKVPSHLENVSEIIKLFFGDQFFHMLYEETNRYHFQNRDKYDRSYKVLKWVDVMVAEMKIFFCNNHSNGASKKRHAKKLLVYRSIFGKPNFR
jgi:hypothetical protein